MMTTVTVIMCMCMLKAILEGEEVKAWLDYESVPLDEVLVLTNYCHQ